MPPGDTARLYHRLTAYEPGREWDTAVDDPRVRQDFEPNVLRRFPAPCKAYPAGLPVTELPRSWRPAPAAALDAGLLARLLHLSAGVVRLLERPDGRPYHFRAIGSA